MVKQKTNKNKGKIKTAKQNRTERMEMDDRTINQIKLTLGKL